MEYIAARDKTICFADETKAKELHADGWKITNPDNNIELTDAEIDGLELIVQKAIITEIGEK